MSSITLYLWTNPVSWDPALQHTMVTTYKPIGTCTPQAPQCYWFCWGDCHTASGSPNLALLKQAAGNLDTAKCITQPNDPSSADNTHAGIPSFYGHFGVCHQVADRTLIATAAPGTPAITVEGADGAKLSFWLYGAYATHGEYKGQSLADNWAQRKQGCGITPEMNNSGSEFSEENLHESLRAAMGGELKEETLALVQDVFTDLRAKKDQLAARVLDKGDSMTRLEFAQQLNQLIADAVARLTNELGSAVVEQALDVKAGAPFRLLDEHIAAREDEEEAENKD